MLPESSAPGDAGARQQPGQKFTCGLLAALLVGCGDGTGPDVQPFASLALISGAGQSDTVLATLPAPLIVQARAIDNSPVPGVAVTFAIVTPGGGSMFAGTSVTDTQGRAADIWKLGTVAGTHRVEARTVDATGTPIVWGSFEATVRPGAPDSVKASGVPAYTFIGDPLPSGSAMVFDAHGNEIAAPNVVWSMDTPTMESVAWLRAVSGSARDSLAVKALFHIGRFSPAWRFEWFWATYRKVDIRFIDECDGNAALFSLGDVVDSVRAVTRFTSVSYVTVPKFGVVMAGTRDVTAWCRNGNVVTPSGADTEYFAQDINTLFPLEAPAGGPRIYTYSVGNGPPSGTTETRRLEPVP
jgi:hypothetical protein